MAKNDNLKDFLTDVADAIREKKGSSELINPQDFSAEIASIQSGGGGGAVTVSAKAINFRDCDGVILHSYTKDEFLALTELPPLPTREGLICQEWNWEFADAVEYVTEYGVLEVGATYITDDGKTRLYITIEDKTRMELPFYFNQDVSQGVIIDWGDGSAVQTFAQTGAVSASHTYQDKGAYIITLSSVEGCSYSLGYGSSSNGIFGARKKGPYCNMLKRVEIGKGVNILLAYGFADCYNLEYVIIPKGITEAKDYAFGYCYNLKSISFPNGLLIGNGLCYKCDSLSSVALPMNFTKLGAYTFQDTNIKSFTPPKAISTFYAGNLQGCLSLKAAIITGQTIGVNTFKGCVSLVKVTIDDRIEAINDYAFDGTALSCLVLPKSIKSIGAGVWGNMLSSMLYYDFSAAEVIPTLANINSFAGIPSDCKIIVPDALFDEWIAATNWSTYASKTIKKSEWDALNA